MMMGIFKECYHVLSECNPFLSYTSLFTARFKTMGQFFVYFSNFKLRSHKLAKISRFHPLGCLPKVKISNN